jgi:outer membrane lipoprotein-sorting protein
MLFSGCIRIDIQSSPYPALIQDSLHPDILTHQAATPFATMTDSMKQPSRLIPALLLCISAILPSLSCAGTEAGNTAADIVEKADRIRFPVEAFQVDVTIETSAPEQDTEIRKYRILSKGNDRTILMTTYPEIDRGTMLLMRDNDLWSFLPSLSQPVRLPLSQRLTGQVANGDLARANFTGDYTAEQLREETIDGVQYHVLELTAARRGVTYHRVLYWVNRENHRPFKAEFYTLSGRHMKTTYYEDFRFMEGTDRPLRLIMEDALRKGEKSVLSYSNMHLRDLPDKIFTKQYLKKLGK